MNLQRPLIAGLTALLAVTVAACGDDDNAATATTETTVAAIATSPEPTEPASDTSEPEGTVPETAGPPSSAAGECPEEPTEEVAEELLVGLTEEEATEAAEACGWTVRVGRIDGEDRPLTLDFRPNRVTVETTDGEVTAILGTG